MGKESIKSKTDMNAIEEREWEELCVIALASVIMIIMIVILN